MIMTSVKPIAKGMSKVPYSCYGHSTGTWVQVGTAAELQTS
jgi:hypothetical protein